MKIVATFDLPNSRLLTIKYDGEKLDALEKLQDQWSSTEYLREFFTKFQKDYYNEYRKSDRAKLVKQAKKLAAALFEKLYELAQNGNPNSLS